MTRSLVSSIVEPVVLTLNKGVGLPGIRNAFFGVNLSGPEFSPWNGQTFPTSGDFLYLAKLGVGFVRLPIAWESIQPTLNAALDATYLGKVKSAIAAAKVVGISTIVDIHNFGYYATQAKWTTTVGYAGNDAVLATGVNVLGDGTLTLANYTDLCTRLATALTGLSGLKGIGIMNEPAPGIVGVNLLTTPNNFKGANWFVTSSSVATQLAAGTNPLGSDYSPAWTITSGGGYGGVAQNINYAAVPYTLSCYAKVASGTLAGQFYIQGTGSSNFTATTSWQRFSFTHTPSAGSAQANIIVAAGSGSTLEISNAQLELGSSATTYAPNIWLPYAQAAINAIRAVDGTVPIYVCGYNYGTASLWNADNFEMAALTGGNLIFEAHQYFDGPQGVGGGGAYSGSYASYSITSSTGAQAFDVFKNWCASQGVAGYIGEWGEPAGADATNWLAVQTAMLADMRAAGIQGTQWFYGANGIQPSNVLNIAGAGDKRLTDMLAS